MITALLARYREQQQCFPQKELGEHAQVFSHFIQTRFVEICTQIAILWTHLVYYVNQKNHEVHEMHFDLNAHFPKRLQKFYSAAQLYTFPYINLSNIKTRKHQVKLGKNLW